MVDKANLGDGNDQSDVNDENQLTDQIMTIWDLEYVKSHPQEAAEDDEDTKVATRSRLLDNISSEEKIDTEGLKDVKSKLPETKKKCRKNWGW